MMHLSILVPAGDNNMSSITGAYEIFRKANQYRQQQGGGKRFDIELVGMTRKVDYSDRLFQVRPHKTISELPKTDLVIVPSLNHNYRESVAANGKLIAWIADRYRDGAAIATICTGAYLVAAAGLLNGVSCSTHWSVTDHFRSHFPEVNLQADRLITDEKGIYTNGGAYSFLNLMIYLVEKYFDRQTAIYCAKVFQVDIDRNSQSPFAIFSGQKGHDDELVMQAQEYIESRPQEKVSVEELSARFFIGRRSFDRRFVKATGNTPLEYVQRVKIESAKKAMERTRRTINEIMYDVGYTDIKAFREVFRKFTGMAPLEYRQRFGVAGNGAPADAASG